MLDRNYQQYLVTNEEKNGKQLYVVGGAVRDALLGTTPKDFDLDVEALLTDADKSSLFRAFSTFKELGVDKIDRLEGFMTKLKDYLPKNLT